MRLLPHTALHNSIHYQSSKINKANVALSKCLINPKSSLESDTDIEDQLALSYCTACDILGLTLGSPQIPSVIKEDTQKISNALEGEIGNQMPELPEIIV